MDAMLTAAAEEYARNIRKMGKPQLTFSQLWAAWWKATHPVLPDDAIAAKCIEMARNPLAIEMISLPDKPLGPY